MASDDGFLTETQREYLAGRHEPPTNNADRQIRSKIRDRTKKALEDLHRVALGFDKTDIDQILFDNKDWFEWEAWEKAQDVDTEEQRHLENMVGLMTLFYSATLDKEPPLLELITEHAIRGVHEDQFEVVENVNVSIEVELGDHVEQIDTDEPGELSTKEARMAHRAGRISDEEWEENQDRKHERTYRDSGEE